jgi:hypothetical protein
MKMDTATTMYLPYKMTRFVSLCRSDNLKLKLWMDDIDTCETSAALRD